MATRLYLVAGPKGDRLVEASTQAAAVNHCARADYSCEVASQKSLVASLAAGVKVEKAGEVEPVVS